MTASRKKRRCPGKPSITRVAAAGTVPSGHPHKSTQVVPGQQEYVEQAPRCHYLIPVQFPERAKSILEDSQGSNLDMDHPG